MIRSSLLVLTFGWSFTLCGQWHTLGTGLDHGVRRMYYDHDRERLYAFGSFRMAGEVPLNGTGYWDGEFWNSMGLGVPNCNVFPVVNGVAFGDSIVVTGSFPEVAGISDTRNTALWDGVQWRSIGPGGSIGILWGMFADENGLTVGGQFDTIAGQWMNNVGRYENGTWTNLCVAPVSNNIVGFGAIAKYQDQYIFGGNVNLPYLREIGYLDGDTMRQLGPGIGGDSWVNDMVVYHDKLFVAGEFYRGSINPSNCVMTWDGTQWADPFPGMEFITQAVDLDVHNDELFISGRSHIPGNPGFYTLARYDGERICLFGKNINAVFSCIASSGTDLYASPNTGGTLGVGGQPVNWIVRYDLSHPSDTCLNLQVGLGELTGAEIGFHVYPNPTNGSITVELAPPWTGTGPPLLDVYDATGKLVLKDQIPASLGPSKYRCELSTGKGLYLLHLHDRSGRYSATRAVVVY